MGTVIFEKDNIKITENETSYKAYALVYEKSYSQGSSVHSDVIDNLNCFCNGQYNDTFNRLDEKILEIDSASEKENENDEYSIWYNDNVKYEYNKLFDVNLISADFTDYIESINVIEFDIDFDDFSIDDIETIYVRKDCNRSFVGDRKKELVINDEFIF